jgi:hypothetical protein
MEYASARTLHAHLFKSGFMPNYICWTKHGESRLMMEEDDEQLDHDDIIADMVPF